MAPWLVTPDILRAEWLCLLIVVGVLFVFRPLSNAFESAGKAFSRVARHKTLSLVVAALLPILLRMALLPVMPPPEVQVEEESSNLLQADTFAHFRLANPPLNDWQHFDTMQVLQRPYYVSMRPPGQGLFLAVGQIVFGHPWAGVCISIGLMCAAVCWMLQGWFAPQWALFGGLLLGIRLGVFSYWMNSYWGGAVSALGGALVLGAFARLSKRPRPVLLVPFCAGIALLALTRIYEGGLFMIPVAVSLLAAWNRAERGSERRRSLDSALVSTLVFLAVLGTWFGYYNWRTTGSVRTSTYFVGRQQQGMTPPFVFGKYEPTRIYSDIQMRRRLGWEVMLYNRNTHWPSLKVEQTWRAASFWRSYIRPLLTIPLLLALFCWKNRLVKFCVLTLLLGLFGSFLTVWGPPYYYAAFVPVLLILVVQGLRFLQTLRIEGQRRFKWATMAVLLVALMICSWLSVFRFRGGHVRDEDVFQWAGYENRMPRRGIVEKMLEAEPGKQIVFVRYGVWHNFLSEWVFNKADLQTSKVIWAHEMGRDSNLKVAAEYSGRKLWVIDADEPHSLPRPYAPEEDRPAQNDMIKSFR